MGLAMMPVSKVASPEAGAVSEPPDVLHLQRTIDSLEKENAWLRAQLEQIPPDVGQGL